MERYTCNGAYLEKFSNGAFVKYSDHVAEVGKITDQLESLRTTLCSSLAAHSDHAAELARVEDDLLKMNNLAYEWRVRAERAEAYVAGQDVRSDFQNAVEMRAALDDLRDTMNVLAAETRASRPVIERLERHNTLLRAECEAWREGERLEIIVVRDSGWDRLSTVCAATDAAGILKGAE